MSKTKKLPEPIRVDASPRAHLFVFAIGAAFRSYTDADPALTAIQADQPFTFDLATHTVRASNAGDAMHAFLASPDAKMIDTWADDERSQRLLYVIPVERLMFSRPTYANIEVSTTHRRRDGAPIRYLRG